MLRIYPRCDQKTAIQFVDYVLERLPFPVQVIQTDNGAEFQSAFHYHVLDKGVGHRYIKPRTPRLNGKVERSHRIDAEEFYALLDGLVIDDAKVFNNKLKKTNYHPTPDRRWSEVVSQTNRIPHSAHAGHILDTLSATASRSHSNRSAYTSSVIAALGVSQHPLHHLRVRAGD